MFYEPILCSSNRFIDHPTKVGKESKFSVIATHHSASYTVTKFAEREMSSSCAAEKGNMARESVYSGDAYSRDYR